MQVCQLHVKARPLPPLHQDFFFLRASIKNQRLGKYTVQDAFCKDMTIVPGAHSMVIYTSLRSMKRQHV